MVPTFFFAIIAYWGIEHMLHRAAYPSEPNIRLFPAINVGREWTLVVSPGYWIARCRKNWIDAFPRYRRLNARRRFIVASNKYNMYLSLVLCVVALTPSRDVHSGFLVDFLWAMAAVRYISRTFEIALAFGLDVIDRRQNRSGLSKATRMKLAFRSYVELIFLSAPVYYAYAVVLGQGKALVLSLSVVTLANVGYAFPENHGTQAYLVFPQVIATLSLVLLSLASYISRERKSKCSFGPAALDKPRSTASVPL